MFRLTLFYVFIIGWLSILYGLYCPSHKVDKVLLQLSVNMVKTKLQFKKLKTREMIA